MQRFIKSIVILLITILLLTACNIPFMGGVSEADAVRTSAAQTVEALRTQAASSA